MPGVVGGDCHGEDLDPLVKVRYYCLESSLRTSVPKEGNERETNLQ